MFIIMLAAVLTGSADPPSKQKFSPGSDLRCGSFCLYVSLKALNARVGSFEQFEAKMGQPTNMGYSMKQLAAVAEGYGMRTLGVKTSLANLAQRKGRFACIAHLGKQGHYVCIYHIDQGKIGIIDPPAQKDVPKEVFQKLWDGDALLISAEPIPLHTLSGYRLNGSAVLAGVSAGSVVAFLGVTAYKKWTKGFCAPSRRSP